LIVDEVTMGSGPAVAPIHIEKRALRKLRTRILPFIFLLYIPKGFTREDPESGGQPLFT